MPRNNINEPTVSRVVSIIIALHSKGPYIAETIRSVLAQTHPDWEMVVVENGSTDYGPEIVRQFSDGRIRLVVSPKHGPGAARNFGLSQATGEWILFLDADDLIEPDHLTALLTLAETNTSAGVVAGGWKEFPDKSKLELKPHRPATFGFCRNELLARAAALAPWVLHAAIIKRASLTEPNPWPERLDNCPDEDTAFWFSVLMDSPVIWAEHFGARYRRYAPSSRSGSGDLSARIAGYAKIVEYNLAEARRRGIEISPKVFGNISMMFEVNYRKAVAANDKPAVDLSLRQASHWLGKCPATDWNIRARKWLGIPIVNRLKRIFQGANDSTTWT